MPGVEPRQRPFLHRHRYSDRLSECGSLEGIQARIGPDPDDLSIPLDEDVVGGAVVAVPLVELAALRRGEGGHDAGGLWVADVVTMHAPAGGRGGGGIW